MNAAAPEVHAELAGLAWLIGTWTGTGSGDYPTIRAFHYREEARFTHVGKAFLAYSQRTWGEDGAPLHSESGYLRAAGDRVELVLAHPFGVAEVSEGNTVGTSLKVVSLALTATTTGSAVAEVVRAFWLEGGALRYTVAMAAGGRPLQRHLTAELHRADDL